MGQVEPGTPAAPRVLALVLNENSGRLLADAGQAEKLRRSLIEAGADLREMAPGKLPARIAAAANSGAAAVLVAGGDGTVACACQSLAGGDLAIGIIPLGTMNLLARDLGLPVDDLDAAARVLAGAPERWIDVGRIGDHVFACACMLGAPARIGHHREVARKSGQGVLALLGLARAAGRTLWRDRPLRLTLVVDGRPMRLSTRSLTITVNALDDASGRAFGRTVLDGGFLCAYAVRTHGAWDVIRLTARLLSGSSRDPALPRISGEVIEVTSPRPSLRLLIDGEEHVLPTPLRFAVWPRALRVLAP